MQRYIQKNFLEFCQKKILLLSGPRQVGKTTFVKSLSKDSAYYNYDNKDDMMVFKKKEWDKESKFVIFDELHKMNNWKLWLKGIYDSEGVARQHIIVTGSARLDIARKMGDSLAGRFFSYHLLPLDLKELKGQDTVQKNYEKLLQFGGFPEPFFESNKKFYTQWKKSHIDLILRQDLLNFEVVKDIDSLENLFEMLTYQVGSTVSYKSLAMELQKDEKTIKKWLNHLENLYLIFRLDSYSKKFPKALKKSGKYYLYDISRIKGRDPFQIEAAKCENLVALSLKKECTYLNECHGHDLSLYFARTLEQKEVDFLICNEGEPEALIEVKLSDNEISPHLRLIGNYLKIPKKIQLVKNLNRHFTSPDGVQVKPLLHYLEDLEISFK